MVLTLLEVAAGETKIPIPQLLHSDAMKDDPVYQAKPTPHENYFC